MDFLDDSVGKLSACNAGDTGLIPGLGRFLEKGNGNSLQYSCLGHPMDRGAWQATVHGVTKSQTRLKWLSTHTHPCCGVCSLHYHLAVPRRLAMCCPVFLCLTLFGFGFQEGISKRFKKSMLLQWYPLCHLHVLKSSLTNPFYVHPQLPISVLFFPLLNISCPIGSLVSINKMEGQSWFCVYKL